MPISYPGIQPRNTFENGGTMDTFTQTTDQPQAKTQQEV